MSRGRRALARVAAALLVCSSAAFAGQEEEGSGEDPPGEAREEATAEGDSVDPSWRRPLTSRNQTPLALLFAYLAPDGARSIPRGHVDLDVILDYSNIIQEQQTEDESEFLRFDLEYLRTVLAVKRGFGRGIEIGASIPFYVYYGGFLDPFVSSFHETLGLPNALRGETPNGLVDYRYRRGDLVVFDGQESVSTLGDLSFEIKKTLVEESRRALALRALVKLPTGEPERLGGSGATDFALGAAFDRVGDKLGVYLNANVHFLGETALFQTRDFFSFLIGADWRFKPRLAAVLQVDYMRPLLAGELDLLDTAGKQLALGLRWRYSERFVYEWRLVEDLSSFSPDFTVAFQVGVRFEGKDR